MKGENPKFRFVGPSTEGKCVGKCQGDEVPKKRGKEAGLKRSKVRSLLVGESKLR